MSIYLAGKWILNRQDATAGLQLDGLFITMATSRLIQMFKYTIISEFGFGITVHEDSFI